MRKAALIVIVTLLATLAMASDQTSELKFTVLKNESGKPVRNASVILHPVDKDGKQGKGGFELKTDPEGRASFNGAPYGKLRVQVLARGYQTYGQDFDITQPQQEIVIKLKRPQGQFSIYEQPKQADEKQKDKPKE